MSERCQAAHDWSVVYDIVCYRIVGAVGQQEQLGVGSKCVCSKLLTTYDIICLLNVKFKNLLATFSSVDKIELELISSVYKAELEDQKNATTRLR